MVFLFLCLVLIHGLFQKNIFGYEVRRKVQKSPKGEFQVLNDALEEVENILKVSYKKNC